MEWGDKILPQGSNEYLRTTIQCTSVFPFGHKCIFPFPYAKCIHLLSHEKQHGQSLEPHEHVHMCADVAPLELEI